MSDNCDALIANLAALAAIFACPMASLGIQKFTGWGKISDKHPLKSQFDGQWLNWQSLTFGKPYWGIHLRTCVSIGFSKDFMYLKVRPKLIFPFIKPVKIPWSAVQSIKQTKFLWASYCIFTIADTPNITIYRSKGFNDYLTKNATLSKVLLDFNTKQQIFADGAA